jgi:hypothetical protein
MQRKPLILLLAAAAALANAAAGSASFTGAASASTSLSSATLAPPTGVSATQINCTKNNPPQIATNWTASTSSFTAGYTIYRSTTSGSGYSQIGTVGANTTSFTDPSTTLAHTTTYYYLVEATYYAWTARSSQTQIRTLNSACR